MISNNVLFPGRMCLIFNKQVDNMSDSPNYLTNKSI